VRQKRDTEFGKNEAHKRAVIEEYRFLKERDMLEDSLEWIRNLSPDSYDERIKLWKAEGFLI